MSPRSLCVSAPIYSSRGRWFERTDECVYACSWHSSRGVVVVHGCALVREQLQVLKTRYSNTRFLFEILDVCIQGAFVGVVNTYENIRDLQSMPCTCRHSLARRFKGSSMTRDRRFLIALQDYCTRKLCAVVICPIDRYSSTSYSRDQLHEIISMKPSIVYRLVSHCTRTIYGQHDPRG